MHMKQAMKWMWMAAAAVMLMAVTGFAQMEPEADGDSQPVGAPFLRSSQEPPEPEAGELVEQYMTLLAAGDFQGAQSLNDMRGMRQYLLERRLADLKRQQPGLTEEDLAEISAKIQLNELNPERLAMIMTELVSNEAFIGMDWTVRGYTAMPRPEHYIVHVDVQPVEGDASQIFLGIKKLGDRWYAAPEINDVLSIRRVGTSSGPRPTVVDVATPEAVEKLFEEYWTLWTAGDMDGLYALYSADFQKRRTQLSVMEQVQDLNNRIGPIVSWRITNSREIGPGLIGLGIQLTGQNGGTPSIMVFKNLNGTWVLDEAQFEPPRAIAPPRMTGPGPAVVPPPVPGAVPAPANFRQDLRPAVGTDVDFNSAPITPADAFKPMPDKPVRIPPAPVQPVRP